MSISPDRSTPGQSTESFPFASAEFLDRRNPDNQRKSSGFERRQFTNSMSEYTEDAAELGQAIDQYKLMHRRRFINYEELLNVIKGLGYSKNEHV